jgi:hypothetical protein
MGSVTNDDEHRVAVRVIWRSDDGEWSTEQVHTD